MIKVYNSILTKDVLNSFVDLSEQTGFTYGWKSNVSKSYDMGHWNIRISEQKEKNGRVDIARTDPLFLEQNFVSAAWKQIQSVIGPRNLVRCYINGYTYGTDSYAHYDEHALYEKCAKYLGASETILIYLNEDWHHDYGGETVFFDENKEIKTSILPKFGRAVIFDSAILHAARPVTRMYGGMRKVLVFKTSEHTKDGKETLFQLLFKKYSNIQHSGGTLFEHLIGTYEHLKKHCSKDVCLAGLLHSVKGTESFQNEELLTNAEILKYTSQNVLDLVDKFSKSTNRIQRFIADKDVDMLFIEWANYKDQASREPTKYNEGLILLTKELNKLGYNV